MLDILDLMEFVKEMLEVQNVEQENVKMETSRLMNYVKIIKRVVWQMVWNVLMLYKPVVHIKVLQQDVVHILEVMVFVQVLVQQLKQIVFQKLVIKLEILWLLMKHVRNIKKDVLQMVRDVQQRLLWKNVQIMMEIQQQHAVQELDQKVDVLGSRQINVHLEIVHLHLHQQIQILFAVTGLLIV